MTKRTLDIVVLGLSLSSSWGNGHATTYRALLAALASRGHRIVFLERDVPWYANARDLTDPAYCELRYYDDLAGLASHARTVRDADAVIVGSYVPDGIAVIDWVLRTATGTTAFYDIDTPVTLAALGRGECGYLAATQIPRFDLYLSFTGGPTLARLEQRLGAAKARALYCSVDPDVYKPVAAKRRWALGYLGTYSADRQAAVERLLIEPARRTPHLRFVVAGAQYPGTIAWPANVDLIEHVPPADHAQFYASLRWALNLTRSDMRAAGHSPSVRLFEAAACGTPLVSDAWEGLDCFFALGREIVVAGGTSDVLATLAVDDAARARIAKAARARVLSEHTAARRAGELEKLLLGERTAIGAGAHGREGAGTLEDTATSRRPQ